MNRQMDLLIAECRRGLDQFNVLLLLNQLLEGKISKQENLIRTQCVRKVRHFQNPSGLLPGLNGYYCVAWENQCKRNVYHCSKEFTVLLPHCRVLAVVTSRHFWTLISSNGCPIIMQDVQGGINYKKGSCYMPNRVNHTENPWFSETVQKPYTQLHSNSCIIHQYIVKIICMVVTEGNIAR